MQLEIRLSMDSGETILAYVQPFRIEDTKLAGLAYDVGVAAVHGVINDHLRQLQEAKAEVN